MDRSHATLLHAVALSSLFVVVLLPASGWAQETKITADDGEVNDQFGGAVAISADGERTLVGTSFDDLDAGNEGSVYVFNRQSDGSWLQQDTLTASDADQNDNFGRAVAISADGQHAVVDVRLEESVYVFDRQSGGAWVQQAKLTASDGEETDRFGGSVAISADGQRGLVGAPKDDVGGALSQGSAYEYGPSSLPVELASFTGQSDGEAAVLSWSTVSEINNAGFRVERRTNDSDPWRRVGFVESRADGGTAEQLLRYQFRTAALEYGTHAFRLVQVDRDGTRTPTDPVTVRIELDRPYALSKTDPHPVIGRAALEITVREAQAATATLYDALGRHVRRLHDGPLSPQETHRLTLDASDLSSGLYVFRIVGEDFSASRKVMVVR